MRLVLIFYLSQMWHRNVEKLIFNLGQLECKLAGWGVTDLEDPKSSQHLMEVKLPWLQRNRFCHVSHFCDNFVTMTSQKTVFRDECNRLFDRDPSTSWIQITNDNLCFGQAAGGIDACQVKKCFACQVITSNNDCYIDMTSMTHVTCVIDVGDIDVGDG